MQHNNLCASDSKSRSTLPALILTDIDSCSDTHSKQQNLGSQQFPVFHPPPRSKSKISSRHSPKRHNSSRSINRDSLECLSNQSTGPQSAQSKNSSRYMTVCDDFEDALERQSRLSKLDKDIEQRLEKIRESLHIGKYKNQKPTEI